LADGVEWFYLLFLVAVAKSPDVCMDGCGKAAGCRGAGQAGQAGTRPTAATFRLRRQAHPRL
jgi:hypothetical protein